MRGFFGVTTQHIGGGGAKFIDPKQTKQQQTEKKNRIFRFFRPNVMMMKLN